MSNLASEIKVVPVSDTHIASFRECLDAVARERRYIGFLEAPPLEAVRDFVSTNFINGNSLQFVAIHSDNVIGWCDILVGSLPGFMHSGRLGMGLKPGFRGMGIGKKLLLTAIQAAREKEIERVELEVFVTNKSAIKLYEKAGFAVEGVKKNARKLDGNYEDSLCMALLIPAKSDSCWADSTQ